MIGCCVLGEVGPTLGRCLLAKSLFLAEWNWCTFLFQGAQTQCLYDFDKQLIALRICYTQK